MHPAERWARHIYRRGRVVRRRLTEMKSNLVIDKLPAPLFVELSYNIMLRRTPDGGGKRGYVRQIRRQEITRMDMLDVMRGSEEFRFAVPFADLQTSLHHSRCDFVRSLPRASRILDIGGTHQFSRDGAFVHMGYLYPFEELVILDLPHAERHELYRHSERAEQVDTPLGPVTYAYGSMIDLSRFGDATFDLVYSGQSIEHVTPEECDLTLAEVWRVLRPGGWFALDTPNGPVGRLHSSILLNPDHKVEYSHAEMSGKLRKTGFEIVDSKGLNYIGAPFAHAIEHASFSESTTAQHGGMFAEIEDCYLLAYVVQKPLEPLG